DFRLANLTGVSFYGAGLTGADLTGAEVRGADFSVEYYDQGNSGSGITLAQLYSTASYQRHDLGNVGFSYNNLEGGNFAGQNLTNAVFKQAALTGADFTAADTRGAAYLVLPASPGATTTNLIWPDGHISGLDLNAGGLLSVRDYHGNQT